MWSHTEAHKGMLKAAEYPLGQQNYVLCWFSFSALSLLFDYLFGGVIVLFKKYIIFFLCVRVCVRVRACVRACVCGVYLLVV